MKILNKLKNIMLSGNQLITAVPGSKILTHDQLKDIKNVHDIFKNSNGVVFILLEWERNHKYLKGHWIVLINHPDYIEIFDPYGNTPRNQWEILQNEFRNEPHLLNLLSTSIKPVYNNEFKLQGNDVDTCGRWVILRGLHKNLSPQKFKKYIFDFSKNYGFKNFDDAVTYYTYEKFGF